MATMETPVLSKRVLRQREAAHYLSCSESTLETLRVFGGGPVFVKIGARTVGYIVEDLERWLATRRRTSTSEPAR
jgi:predicted DNA-binding transcriptional regulator AlpA